MNDRVRGDVAAVRRVVPRTARKVGQCPAGRLQNDPGGCNVLFGDGSVRIITQYIDPNTWVALSTRNVGEVIASYD